MGLLQQVWDGVLWLWARRLILVSLLPLVAAAFALLGLRTLHGGMRPLVQAISDKEEWMLPVSLGLCVLATCWWLVDSKRIRRAHHELATRNARMLEEDQSLREADVSVVPRVFDDANHGVNIVVDFRNLSGHVLQLQGVSIDYLAVDGALKNIETLPLKMSTFELGATHREPTTIQVRHTLERDVRLLPTTGFRVSWVMTRNRAHWQAVCVSFSQIEVTRQGARA